jgi:thiamine-phosphate pyrophosphorylase
VKRVITRLSCRRQDRLQLLRRLPLQNTRKRMKKDFYKLTFVTQKGRSPTQRYLQRLESCLAGGITAVQLREKELSNHRLREFGKALQTVLLPEKIPLIVNDSLELAIELNADGLHLGQSDGDVIAARKQLGPDKIIGISINSLAELIAANTLPVDYIGIGAIFPTKSKTDVATVWRLNQLQHARSRSQHKIIAIGGIDNTNAQQVIAAGADGIAAISAFHDTPSPEQVTRALRHIIGETL